MPRVSAVDPETRIAQREELERQLAEGTITLGQAIKRMRQNWAGITQQRMAQLAGISVTTLSGLERDNGNATLDTVQRVLRVLGARLTIQLR
ncbi:helix-turn-helix domain-containing protein [Halovibrio salipaludis]|nr:helix-turn-helix transcriptional regulator [Halovibrio salipaludis]